MPAKVVDASALAALVFGEPDADAVAARLGDGPLFAPSLLRYELASVARKKLERHPGQAEALLEALGLFDELDCEEIDVEPRDLLESARASGLTAYDAAYLWLARELSAELVTLDRELARAAGVSTPADPSR